MGTHGWGSGSRAEGMDRDERTSLFVALDPQYDGKNRAGISTWDPNGGMLGRHPETGKAFNLACCRGSNIVPVVNERELENAARTMRSSLQQTLRSLVRVRLRRSRACKMDGQVEQLEGPLQGTTRRCFERASVPVAHLLRPGTVLLAGPPEGRHCHRAATELR